MPDEIERNSPVPYYYQLAEILRRQIEEHGLRGEVYPLPSEHALAERYGLSRATVRHALDRLASEGWIYREKGRGSFAPARRVEQELTQLISTTEDMARRGWQLETRVVQAIETSATPLVARALALEADAPVYLVERLRVVDGEPLSLQSTTLPAFLCPGLLEHDLTRSLYRLLEERFGLKLWSATETLRARPASPREAAELGVAEGDCMLYMERVTYTADGLPIEFLESVWRGDRYNSRVTLTRA